MIAKRMNSLTTQYFASLDEKIAAIQSKGIDVIRLDIGSPDMPPAEHIIQALAEAASKPDRHGYQSHTGNIALRQAWVDMYAREYDVVLDRDREIMPLLGSKEGIFHIHQALVNPGDVVLVPDPGYLTYTQATSFAGGEPYYLPLSPALGYTPDFSAIPTDILNRAKMIWLNYPNNPTGASVDLDFFESAVEFASRHNIVLCHDAAYSQVVFDGYRAPSLLEAVGGREVGVEFNTLSKSHNMAGWRVGAIVGNESIIHSLYRLKTNVDSGHFLPVMEAATAAMVGDQSWTRQRNKIYEQRRDVLINGLKKLGLHPENPRASLYVWCPVPWGWDSITFCESLLEKAHVSLTPGKVFGRQGDRYIRIAITTPAEKIIQAIERIADVWPLDG